MRSSAELAPARQCGVSAPTLDPPARPGSGCGQPGSRLGPGPGPARTSTSAVGRRRPAGRHPHPRLLRRTETRGRGAPGAVRALPRGRRRRQRCAQRGPAGTCPPAPAPYPPAPLPSRAPPGPAPGADGSGWRRGPAPTMAASPGERGKGFRERRYGAGAARRAPRRRPRAAPRPWGGRTAGGAAETPGGGAERSCPARAAGWGARSLSAKGLSHVNRRLLGRRRS